MQESTKKLTFGAMIVAIFGVLLLANRQTAGLLEEMFLYIFPIPMVAFSARYDWKNSLPVLVCMALISILFGTFSTIFYAVSGAAVGLVLGTRIHRKRDMTKTLILVMVLSVAANLLSTYVLASLMGYDLAADLSEMETMMTSTFQKVAEMSQNNGNTAMAENYQFMISSILTPTYIRRMFLVSLIVMGLVQGFLVFQISLLILRRLRYPVPRPKALAEYVPPKWTGFAAAACYFVYSATLMNPPGPEYLQLLLQAAGMFGLMFLVIFGYIALIILMRRLLPSGGFFRIFRILIPCLLFITMPPLLLIIGFLYISTDMRRRINPARSAGNTDGSSGSNASGAPSANVSGSRAGSSPREEEIARRRRRRMSEAMQLMDDYSTSPDRHSEENK